MYTFRFSACNSGIDFTPKTSKISLGHRNSRGLVSKVGSHNLGR